jgi:hypothetical protein
MKKLIYISILFFVGCSNQKNAIKSPKPKLVITESATYNAGDSPISEENIIYYENNSEGIGVGSIGTIGHGVSHMLVSETKQNIIHINNSKIHNTSTNMGNVAYKIPTNMKVRNTYQVIVRISKSTAQIYENMNGEIRTSTIPITQTMEVKVIDSSPSDDKMFDIVENNKAEQIIENNETYTQWTWDITPKKTGNGKIKIVISIIKDGGVKESVYEDSVSVDMNLSKQIPFIIGKYWQYVLSTIIIPFGVWFYNKKRKKTRVKKTNEKTN